VNSASIILRPGTKTLTTIRLCCAAAAILLSLCEPARAADWRHRIESRHFAKTAPGQWASPTIKTRFAYDELIYSWHPAKPGDSFRLYLKAVFGPQDESEWLYAGFWGSATDGVTNRPLPAFDRGVIDMDWLKLTTNASAFQFKVISAGRLRRPPSITVVASTKAPAAVETASNTKSTPGRVLDVPLRRQMNSAGERLRDRCQSAALASAMEYYGKSVPLEDIVRHTHDPEYNYPGLWPRVIAAAREFGFDGYIERFRDWPSVKRTLAENKMILCSMRLKEGAAKAPPYASMGNHIVVLCGVTDDGRVVVTDSALGKSGEGYLCQWLQDDFETVWMRTKGGVAMVICPPKGAPRRVVKNLPPFPINRTFLPGDDH